MATRPDPPMDITGSVSSGILSISWTPATTGGPVSSFTAIGLGFPRSISIIVDSTVSTANIVAVNGTTYIPSVIANGVGNVGSSSIPGGITPLSVPGPPTNVRAVYSNTTGFATITWNAPTSTGGSPITSYTLVSNPTGITTTVTDTNATVTGFTYGTPYTFTVRATNSEGSSAPSAPSASITPITVPLAPTNTASVLTSSGMNISWITPTSTGGTPITGYAILNYTSPSTFTSTLLANSSTISSVTLSTLTNGISYNFGVIARNAVGFSPASPLTSSVLYYNAPVAPAPVVASRVSTTSSILVSWANIPANYQISSFNITSVPSTTLITTSSLSTVISTLTCGTSYKFSVRANNLRGTSATATMATGIIPLTIPNPPSTVTAVAGLLRATVSWTTPTFNGGSTIIGYNITPYDSSGNSGTTVSTTASVLTTVISSLTATMPYTFGVSSRNVVGYSQPRITQNPVTVFNVPGVPTNVSSIAKNTAAIVNWTPPSGNGLPISSYTFTTTPAGGSTVYYDSSGGSAVIGSLLNATTYTILMTANNTAGAGAVASTTVTPTSNIVVPAYIPNPGLVTGPRIYAQSGPYVSIFADSNFQNFSYGIPLGTWSTLSNISTLQSLTSGATTSTISGNVSVVFPQGLSTLALRLNNGENFSGLKEVIYTSTSAASLLSGAGGQFSTIASGDWDYARSVSLGEPAPPPNQGPAEMVLNITIPANDPYFIQYNSVSVILSFMFGNSNSITINWGDSTTPDTWTNTRLTGNGRNWDSNTSYDYPYHDYQSSGSFTITITGTATGFNGFLAQHYQTTNYTNSIHRTHPATYLRSVSSFGNLGLTNLSGAFSGCINLLTVPTTLPSSLTDISYMFSAAKSFSQNLGTWNVSNITNSTGIFDNTCPMLSSTGVNYPPFSSAFRTTNPYNGTYYGRTISPMILTFNLLTPDNRYISLPNPVHTNINDIMIVDWGNGFVNVYKPRNLRSGLTHTSFIATTYGNGTGDSFTVTVYGTNSSSRPEFLYPGSTSSSFENKITSLSSWGNVFTNITNVLILFRYCENLIEVPSSLPSSVTNANQMFFGCIALNQDLSSWNATNVTGAFNMFESTQILRQYAKYPQFSSALQATNPYTGNYYGTTVAQAPNQGQPEMVLNITIPANDPTFGLLNTINIILLFTFGNSDSLTIDWGDSTTPDTWNNTINNVGNWDSNTSYDYPYHAYTSTGSFTITITGTATGFNGILATNNSNLPRVHPATYLISVSSLGTLGLTSLSGAFSGCINLTSVPSTLPSTVTNISYMFSAAKSFSQNLGTWNVSNITNATGIFDNACPMLSSTGVNYPPFSSGFRTTNPYNGTYYGRAISPMILTLNLLEDFYPFLVSLPTPVQTNINDIIIVDWGTGFINVYKPMNLREGLTRLLFIAYDYPEITSSTVVTVTVYGTNSSDRIKLTNMITLQETPSFTPVLQTLSTWGNIFVNFSSITNMSELFSGCRQLTSVAAPPLSVTNMTQMFKGCVIFNQNISSWNVGNVTNMTEMFSGCIKFNQNISSWNVGNVTNMLSMFENAYEFNQPLNSWNVSNVTIMNKMFSSARVFNQPLNSWNVGNVTSMQQMFSTAFRFNQDLSAWTPTSVTNASNVFQTTKILREYAKYPQFTTALQATNPYTGTYYGTTVSTA